MKSLRLIIQSIFIVCFYVSSLAQTKPYEQIGAMIKANSYSTENPTYVVPCGTRSSDAYLMFAISSGDGVQTPISYLPSTFPPASYYVNFSKVVASVERGKSFDLVLTPKIQNSAVTSVYTYAFADWNRDGVFETDLGKNTINNSTTKKIFGGKYTISVPQNAPLGKTRIRVRFNTQNLTTVTPNDAMVLGYIYDFVLFVKETTPVTNNYLLNVSSSNTNIGSAIIATDSPSNDGKYPAQSSVTVQATKTGLSSFIGWTDGMDILSTNETYTFTMSKPVYLIALFATPTPILETPQISTAANPIWYQIKNAQTDVRLNTFIAYDVNIPAGYTTALRIQKPEDYTSKFLWRLETSANDMVKLVNRGTNKQIYSPTGALNEALSVADVGSDFFITPSGNANGSFSVKYNNANDKLLNGGTSFNVLLYNAGVGTGSGWYFYRVPAELTNVNNIREPYFNIYAFDKIIHFDKLNTGDKINIYNLLGHKITGFVANTSAFSHKFEEKGVFIVTVQSIDHQLFSKKIVTN